MFSEATLISHSLTDQDVVIVVKAATELVDLVGSGQYTTDRLRSDWLMLFSQQLQWNCDRISSRLDPDQPHCVNLAVHFQDILLRSSLLKELKEKHLDMPLLTQTTAQLLTRYLIAISSVVGSLVYLIECQIECHCANFSDKFANVFMYCQFCLF